MTKEKNKGKGEFYLVRDEILPKSIRKTIVAKEMVQKGEVRTVNEAVKKAQISRSAYYKYKDYVFSFYEATQSRTVTIGIRFSYKSGSIASILNCLDEAGAVTLAVNQALPVQGISQVDITAETANIKMELEKLLSKVRALKGVKKADIIGKA